MSSPPSDRARLICIGTHHKTGTIWMRKVWRAIARDQNIPFMQMNRAKRMADIAPSGPQIIVNWSSAFPKALFDHPEARFFHIIRDPRDVLLSGMRYHRVAPLKNEKFLGRPRDDLGGRTYQEHLNALPDDRSRLLFEMDNKHAKTVDEMLNWPYGHPHAVEIRYEDLIADIDCLMFRGFLETCDVADLDVARAVQTFWDHSLFGGLADPAARTDRIALHVRADKKKGWASALPRNVAEIYATKFGGALKTLGYARDADWVGHCPEGATATA